MTLILFSGGRLAAFVSLLLAWTAVLHSGGAASAAEIRTLDSPDGRIKVRLQIPEGGGYPIWSATFREKAIFERCGLGIQAAGAGGGDLMAGARIVDEKKRTVDEKVRVHFGKAESARDRFNEHRLTLEDAKGRRTDVIFRCYNDAIALRYEILSDGAKQGSITISDETTSFRLAREPRAFVQYLEHYKTSHEHQVVPTPYGEIRGGALLDLPLTFSWADGHTWPLPRLRCAITLAWP